MIPEVHGQLKNWGGWAEKRPVSGLGYAQIRYEIEKTASSTATDNEAALRLDRLLAEFCRRWPDHARAIRAKYLYRMTDRSGAKHCRTSLKQYKIMIDRTHFWLDSVLREHAA